MELNIYELIYLYHLKDPEALPLLIRTYRPMVHRIWRQSVRNMEEEDFRQMADSVMVDCLETYRLDLGPAFSTYFRVALSRRCATIARNRSYEQPEEGTVFFSLDEVFPDGKQMMMEIVEDTRTNVARQVHARLLLEETFSRISKTTRQKATQVLTMKSMEYSIREICEETGLSKGQVRYILQQVEEYRSAACSL